MPFLLLAAHSRVANWWDLEAFDRWSAHQPSRGLVLPSRDRSFATLYRDTGCNYPPLGVVASAGAMTAIKAAMRAIGATHVDHRQAFRAYLAVFEALSILLVLRLLVALDVPHPTATAAGLYLLPSSWAGGAVWGQIDVVTTAILLGAALCFVRVACANASRPALDELAVVAGAAALAAALETKQTAAFSLPGLLALATVALVALGRRHGGRRALRAGALAAASAAAVLLALERAVFEPPAGHRWIASYVWTTGAWHTGRLSGNGPNVWTLLGRPLASSSDVPLVAFLTPRQLGHATFVAVVAFLLVMQATAVRDALRSSSRVATDGRWLCATALVVTGLTNFALGVFVVGTHERHMVHAFPFLLLGVFALHRCDPSSRSRAQVALAVAAAAVYGAVVYGVLTHAPWLDLPSAAMVLLAAFLALATGYTRTILARRRARVAGPASAAGAPT